MALPPADESRTMARLPEPNRPSVPRAPFHMGLFLPAFLYAAGGRLIDNTDLLRWIPGVLVFALVLSVGLWLQRRNRPIKLHPAPEEPAEQGEPAVRAPSGAVREEAPRKAAGLADESGAGHVAMEALSDNSTVVPEVRPGLPSVRPTREVRCLQGHADAVWCVIFLHQGTSALSA